MKLLNQNDKGPTPGKTEDAEYIRHPSEPDKELEHMETIDKEREKEYKKEEASLTDNERDVSKPELQDLDNAEKNIPADESRSRDIPDTEDNDGAPLNEGPDEEDLFDTGENQDVPPSDLFPEDDDTA